MSNLNIGVKSALARLLATENITVSQSNSKTAWFDVERRVLNLPIWDVELYVYDMLVAHEVGHALYTPADGWHDSQKDMGIPRSYLNVVEDARIEKLTKRKYPGLVHTFSRAYRWFAQEDFFKLEGRELFEMKLIDRINIHFKLGDSIKVPFTAEELPFVDMVANCETFQDVADASLAIYNFWKDKKKDSLDELQEMKSQMPEGDGDEFDDFDMEYEEGEEESGVDVPADEGEEESEEGDDEEESDAKYGSGSEYDQESNDETSDTDESFRSREDSLLNQDVNGTRVIKMFPEKLMHDIITPYEQYVNSPRDYYRFANNNPSLPKYDITLDDIKGAYRIFMRNTERSVAYMVKEFQMKKAAYQYSRAKVSNSGSLDTTKLHMYKFSEDVFRRVTTLADAKSHGMVITIDFSASMQYSMYDTLTQAINLALFCRRVNIPFEVYTFTTGNNDVGYDSHTVNDGEIAPWGLRMNQLIHRKMNKSQFERALFDMYCIASGYINEYDHLGGTPANEALNAVYYILKKFRHETKVQKLINIFLTDGDASSIRSTFNTYSLSRNYSYSFQVSHNKVVRLKNNHRDLSIAILEKIRSDLKTINIGYFLGDNGTFRGVASRLSILKGVSYNVINANARQEKAAYTDVFGYDAYFLLRSKSINIIDDEFEVEEDANKNKLAREFGKYSKNKRVSRILLDNFVKAVA